MQDTLVAVMCRMGILFSQVPRVCRYEANRKVLVGWEYGIYIMAKDIFVQTMRHYLFTKHGVTAAR